MSGARTVSIRVGSDEIPLAPDSVLEALFSTVSYRLEPNGWATRFPTILDRLREGRLDAMSADRALSELAEIGAELRGLPVDRVVWSMQDLRKRDDSRELVRHDASNAFDYFVARDGRPILTCLTEAVQRSRMSGDAILVGSSVRHRNVVGSLVLFVFGALVGIVGYFFFPDLMLVPDHTSDKVEQHGLLVWPLGGMIAVVGMLGTIGALYPSFSEWMRSQKRALGVVLVAAIGFVVYWAWR